MKIKIVLVGNDTWAMYNFRLYLIKFFQRSNFEVYVISPWDEYFEKLAKHCPVFNPNFDKKGMNPFRDIATIISYLKIYRRIRPDIIFHYTVKPIIYGSLVARILKIPSVAISTGLGYVFIRGGLISGLVKFLYKFSLKFASRIYFLNEDDRSFFISNGIVESSNSYVLPGEGIDTEKFKPVERTGSNDTFIFLIAARMLWDKGIGEFVEAARILKKKYDNLEFHLLGFLEVENPTAITKKEMERWSAEGNIKYLGVSDNVRKYLEYANCVVLPSYREGISRTLLEAAAMEIPIITTNVPGCKDVVDDGINGFLCKVKDPVDLADKMEKMIQLSYNERIEMGRRGRQKILNKFDSQLVIKEYTETIEKFAGSIDM